MLLLHRVTPFLAALFSAIGIAAPLFLPVAPVVSLVVALGIAALLLARLAQWRITEPRFWFFVGTPLLLLTTSYTLLLFLESDVLKIALGFTAAFLLFFFSENLFTYLHLPAAYRVQSIEHMSLVLNVVSIFFLAASLYGFRLFLALPLWLLVPAAFALTGFLVASTLWVCKIERAKLLPYAFGGALILTELFLALTYLPTGFFTNGALLAVFFYAYLGISRAHVLQKLSPLVAKRYVGASLGLAVIILSTAKWV